MENALLKQMLHEFLANCANTEIEELGTSRRGNRKIAVMEEEVVYMAYEDTDVRLTQYIVVVSREGFILHYQIVD